MPTPEGLRDFVRSHPAWEGRYPGAVAGFTEPDFENLAIHLLTDETVAALSGRGFVFEGTPGADNFICLPSGLAVSGLRIMLFGKDRIMLAIGNAPNLTGFVRFGTNDHVVVMGDTPEVFRMATQFRGGQSGLFVGAGCSANHVDLVIQGPGASIRIGDDGMISSQVVIHNTDSHAMIPLDGEPRMLNPPAPVTIEPHVWLGMGATVQKGVTVGRGAIVAGHAVAAADVPSCVVVAGIPAVIKRVRTTWTRAARPDAALIEQHRVLWGDDRGRV